MYHLLFNNWSSVSELLDDIGVSLYQRPTQKQSPPNNKFLKEPPPPLTFSAGNTTTRAFLLRRFFNTLPKLLEFLRKDPDRTTLIYGDDCNAKICDDYLQKDIRNNMCVFIINVFFGWDVRWGNQ